MYLVHLIFLHILNELFISFGLNENKLLAIISRSTKMARGALSTKIKSFMVSNLDDLSLGLLICCLL